MKRILSKLTIVIAVMFFYSPLAAQNNLSGNDYLGMSLPADFEIFNATSPWNTLIGVKPKIDTDSKQMIKHLIDTLNAMGLKPVIGINYRQWTPPIHVIDADKAPKRDVLSTDDHLYETIDPDQDGIAEDIPLPDGIWSDADGDGHMILVDTGKMKMWEFSFAEQAQDGSWQASIIDTWDLNGPGYRPAFSGRYWWRSGARGSGAPLIAGLIRPEELKKGVIQHALAFGTPVNRKKIRQTAQWSWELCSPVASRTDGYGVGKEYIPEGVRLQLNPGLDLDALGLSGDAKVIARALQEYGAYVVENTRGFPLYFQNLGPDGGEWNAHPGLADLQRIPLNEFYVLDCDVVTK
jgi:hypothetical protein